MNDVIARNIKTDTWKHFWAAGLLRVLSGRQTWKLQTTEVSEKKQTELMERFQQKQSKRHYSLVSQPLPAVCLELMSATCIDLHVKCKEKTIHTKTMREIFN